jgi:hypothetical protein
LGRMTRGGGKREPTMGRRLAINEEVRAERRNNKQRDRRERVRESVRGRKRMTKACSGVHSQRERGQAKF